MNRLTIIDTAIRQDRAGRFNLNDLHRAAGGDPKNRPNYWLANDKTKSLVSALEAKAGFPAIQSKQGVGTFVAKQLVYAYAMWISPEFSLEVIDAYDALIQGQLKKQDWRRLRHEAASSYKVMSAILKISREAEGKSVKPHHFMNEAKLINGVMTGVYASLDRESLNGSELDLLAHLEEVDAVMIGQGLPYPERKERLLREAFAARPGLVAEPVRIGLEARP